MSDLHVCSYCGREMSASASLQSDPTIHRRCAEMRDYDNRLAEKMASNERANPIPDDLWGKKKLTP